MACITAKTLLAKPFHRKKPRNARFLSMGLDEKKGTIEFVWLRLREVEVG